MKYLTGHNIDPGIASCGYQRVSRIRTIPRVRLAQTDINSFHLQKERRIIFVR